MPTQITLQTTEAITPNPCDLWQIETDLPSDDTSFAATAGDDDENDDVIWSVALPGDVGLAQRILSQRLDALNQRQRAITVAGDFLQRVEAPEDEGSFAVVERPEGLSKPFGSESLGSEPLPEEVELFQILASYSQLDEAESFAPGWLKKLAKPVTDWSETLTEYNQFIRQAGGMLKPTMRIETTIAQAGLAHTLVRADGDLETVFHRRAAAAQMALHHQSTQLTLETRQSLAFFLTQISAGAISLAGKFYAAQWAALPAAYRFARDVMRRAKEDQLLARMKQLTSQETTCFFPSL